MNRFVVGVVLVQSMLVPTLTIAAPATSQATTTTAPAAAHAPSGRRADPARHPAIQPAIAMLTKEIEAALRKGEDAPRASSDYFQTEPATDLQPAAVIAALRRPIANDPRVAAYVKWQLLSGLPKELDEKTAADLIAVYRTAAPEPLPMPGVSKSQRDELERMIRGAREKEAESLSARFEQIEERAARDNQHILAYRDALFAALPPGYEGLAAGFEDAVVRMNAGVDPAEHTRNVCKILSHWSETAPAEQLKQMLRAVQQLEKKKGPEHYTKVAWHESYGRMNWSKSQESLAGAQLAEAQKELDERIRNPTAPLKMKEEK